MYPFSVDVTVTAVFVVIVAVIIIVVVVFLSLFGNISLCQHMCVRKEAETYFDIQCHRIHISIHKHTSTLYIYLFPTISFVRSKSTSNVAGYKILNLWQEKAFVLELV